MIIAVDFDGILAEDSGQFPAIGKPIYKMIAFVQELIDDGHEVILWTSRVDLALEEVVQWCENRGLHFCAINDNAPSNKAKYSKQYPNGTRKIYADIYIDDHDPKFVVTKHDWGVNTAITTLIGYVRRAIECQEVN